MELPVKKLGLFLALLFGLSVNAGPAHGFCGFYLAKADPKIFNKASLVVLARQEDKTVITMVNDFKGDPKEFAVVIPAPTLKRPHRADQLPLGETADRYGYLRLRQNSFQGFLPGYV